MRGSCVLGTQAKNTKRLHCTRRNGRTRDALTKDDYRAGSPLLHCHSALRDVVDLLPDLDHGPAEPVPCKGSFGGRANRCDGRKFLTQLRYACLPSKQTPAKHRQQGWPATIRVPAAVPPLGKKHTDTPVMRGCRLPVQLCLVLRLCGLDHERSRHGPRHGGAVESVVLKRKKKGEGKGIARAAACLYTSKLTRTATPPPAKEGNSPVGGRVDYCPRWHSSAPNKIEFCKVKLASTYTWPVSLEKTLDPK